jgi:hypothetical protein
MTKKIKIKSILVVVLLMIAFFIKANILPI